MSRTSLIRIKDVSIQKLVQELKTVDHKLRQNYVIRIKELARGKNEFINQLIMSDEAHFFVNKQKCLF